MIIAGVDASISHKLAGDFEEGGSSAAKNDHGHEVRVLQAFPLRDRKSHGLPSTGTITGDRPSPAKLSSFFVPAFNSCLVLYLALYSVQSSLLVPLNLRYCLGLSCALRFLPCEGNDSKHVVAVPVNELLIYMWLDLGLLVRFWLPSHSII
ncbi:hypothetical protein NL676_020908 [Syzygium grande]|nr:hypothetical protein NL676_020908 [Syzygium grande]